MNDVIEQNTPQDDNNRNYMMIIYGLYALSLVTAGCAALIGVILAYVQRDDMRGTIYENHITYLIKTFWVSLAAGLVGACTTIILIGFLILGAGFIWYVYRVVAGFVKFYDGKTVSPDGWL